MRIFSIPTESGIHAKYTICVVSVYDNFGEISKVFNMQRFTVCDHPMHCWLKPPLVTTPA